MRKAVVLILGLLVVGCGSSEGGNPADGAACAADSATSLGPVSAPVNIGETFLTQVTVGAGMAVTYTFTDAVAGDFLTARLVADADRLRLSNGDSVEVFSEVDNVPSGMGKTPALESGVYDLLLTCNGSTSACAPVLNISTDCAQ